jgi:hypothetical protein
MQSGGIHVPFGGDSQAYGCRSSSSATMNCWVSSDDVPQQTTASRTYQPTEKPLHVSKQSSSVMKTIYFIGFLSWVVALHLSNRTRSAIQSLEGHLTESLSQIDQHQSTWLDLKSKLQEQKKQVIKLKETHKNLQREVEVQTELNEANVGLNQMPLENDEKSMASWLSRREYGLSERITQLQNYLQTFSRQQTLERYDPFTASLCIPCPMPLLTHILLQLWTRTTPHSL